MHITLTQCAAPAAALGIALAPLVGAGPLPHAQASSLATLRRGADIGVVMRVSNYHPRVGQSITYTAIATNWGSLPADGPMFIHAITPQNNRDIEWDINASSSTDGGFLETGTGLAVHESVTMTVVLRITQFASRTVPETFTVQFCAGNWGTVPDNKPSNNCVSRDVTTWVYHKP
jgi:uncharacterized repeat protein (TIGR01451 family)